MKIGYKLLITFILWVAIVGLIHKFIFESQMNIQKELEEIVLIKHQDSLNFQKGFVLLERLHSNCREIIIKHFRKNNKGIHLAQKEIFTSFSELRSHRKSFETLIAKKLQKGMENRNQHIKENNLELLKRMQTKLSLYKGIIEKYFLDKDLGSHHYRILNIFETQLEPLAQEIAALGKVLENQNEMEFPAALRQFQKSIESKIIQVSTIIPLSTVLLMMIYGFYIFMSMIRPLSKLNTLVKEISKGNLNIFNSIKSKDEIGSLAKSFMEMTVNLKNTMIHKDNLNSIINSMMDPLIIMDEMGRIELVNKATSDISGYTIQELKSQELEKILPDWPEIKEALSNSQEHYISEKIFLTKNGKRIPVIIAGSVILKDENQAKIFNLAAHDISLRKKVEEEMQNMNERIIHIQEEERSRIAMEIHDEFNQDLFALKLNIQSVYPSKQYDTNENKNSTKNIIDSINAIMLKASELSHNLSPIGLKNLGLHNAVEEMVDIFQKKYNFKVTLNAAEIDSYFPAKWDINFYRIIQEALTNIAKHANATQVLIKAKTTETGLLVLIEDNGIGFEMNSVPTMTFEKDKLGLSIMKERARLFGGNLIFVSELHQGTKIVIFIPNINS
jgi:PAS domain S-box-containing protein